MWAGHAEHKDRETFVFPMPQMYYTVATNAEV